MIWFDLIIYMKKSLLYENFILAQIIVEIIKGVIMEGQIAYGVMDNLAII